MKTKDETIKKLQKENRKLKKELSELRFRWDHLVEEYEDNQQLLLMKKGLFGNFFRF